MLAQFDASLIESLPTIRVPTLVLVGGDDTNFLGRRRLHGRPRSPARSKVVIPGAGHAANLDQPEAFNQAVEGFLSDRSPSDYEVLIALNRDYIASVQNGDVARFREILADDFLCSNPDGSLVDKTAFLAQTARPVTISGLSIDDVKVRILGDVAIIHARTSYRTSDGEQRHGRYTDVWARRTGTWLAVSAHVTR